MAEVVFVNDMARYGLHLHLGAEIPKISLASMHALQWQFSQPYGEDLAQELDERASSEIWICKQALWPKLSSHISLLRYRAEALGAPYQGRIILRIAP